MGKFIGFLLSRAEQKDFREVVNNLSGLELENEVEVYHKEKLKNLNIPVVSESLRDYMATRFAQTSLQTWDSELSNKHREAILEDWIDRNGEGLTIQANIAKDAYSLADEMLKHR